jgi:hypothetical protein
MLVQQAAAGGSTAVERDVMEGRDRGRPTWRAVAAVCLVVGPLATFAQYLVTPLPGGDATVTETLDAVARHQSAMRWALVLDVPLILVIPALLFAGLLAGAATSRLAAVATGLVVLPSIAAVVLLGQDALLYVAAQQPDRAAAVALVQDFVDNAFVAGVTFGYLGIHVVAFPLLALALRRARVLPLALAVGLAIWPILELAGIAAGAAPVAAAGYLLQFAALASGAFALTAVGPARRTGARVAPAAS